MACQKLSPIAVSLCSKLGRIWLGKCRQLITHTTIHKTVFPNADIRSIKDATACFKGVQRPLNKEDDGENVYVYAFITPQTVIWKADMACVVAIADSPSNAVFTVHIRPKASLQGEVGDVWGAITKWEFVGADADRPTLPHKFGERYSDTLWDREG